MAGEDIFEMSQRELRRLHIIHKAIEGALRQTEAAEILSLSDRQIRRLIKRVRDDGDGGVIHKSRGKPSNRSLPGKIKRKVIELYRKKYEDFGPTLASEKLLEIDGIAVNDETLRKWLIASGDWKKVRKSRRHRQWRERKHYLGEMVQIDGSHHDWFEGRGSECVLMGYIDDATGRVFARFYEYEGTIPAMDSFRKYIRRYGIPLSIYLDKHTTYKSPAKPSLTDDIEPLSEFERAMKELGVQVIHAHSPQAKGRVERLFKTFQDRLVREMRLRGIGTIEEANKFLKRYIPLYNRRFSVKPKEKGDIHRDISKGLNLDRILCIKTERALRNDFTVAHSKKLYQIEDKIKTDKVIVEERIDGSMVITCNDECVRFKEIHERPEKQKKQRPLTRKVSSHTPTLTHPWRRPMRPKSNGWIWAVAKRS